MKPKPIPKLPCKECPDRRPGCHADCTHGYKEWSEYKRQENQALHSDDDAVKLRIESIRKSKAYFRKHKKK